MHEIIRSYFMKYKGLRTWIILKQIDQPNRSKPNQYDYFNLVQFKKKKKHWKPIQTIFARRKKKLWIFSQFKYFLKKTNSNQPLHPSSLIWPTNKRHYENVTLVVVKHKTTYSSSHSINLIYYSLRPLI